MSEVQRHSRRDFLHGRAAAQAMAEALAPGADDTVSRAEDSGHLGELSRGGREVPLVSIRRRAMACEFEVQLPAAGHAQFMQRVLDALDLVDALEAQMTVYRPDSELQRVNRRAAAEPVEVEPRLFDLLRLARELHRATGGALDITSGPLSEVWGFSRRSGQMPTDADIAAALERVGMDQVVFDDAGRTVAIRRPGVALHLNCIGKGYALDRMAAALDDGGVAAYLLHCGRSSVLARGGSPGGEPAGWAIGLRHPLRPEARLGEFLLADEALGTSGSATQSFVHEGRRYGHLLDPRTGRPAEGVYTATAIAPTAAEADALSTAFYILGPEGTAAYCATRTDVAALLVCPDGDGPDITIHTYNLGENRWRPTAGD